MTLSDEFKDMLFPHDEMRPIQEELIKSINHAVTHQQNLIAHAPTGLGKTAAALAPSIQEAIKKGLTVFFLTSRHTQHKLAMETVHAIKNKYGLKFSAVDIIGKKWLCLQSGVIKLTPRDFSDYCQKIREDGLCEYYDNMKEKGEVSKRAKELAKRLRDEEKTDTESITRAANEAKLCPYELALLLAKDASVIIGDYYYIFHPSIRENLLKRTGKEIGKIILIIDEGHNLPDRLKDLASHRVNTYVLKRAIEEAKKHKKKDIMELLEMLENNIISLSEGVERETYVGKHALINNIKESFDYDDLMKEMTLLADLIREEQKQSFLGSVASFLEAWDGEDKGFTRILSRITTQKGEEALSVQYRCLDPSLITRDIIKQAYATVLMSGTLSPTSMYKEVLGFDTAEETTYKSPFPQSNKLNIIIPKTSTKYETRNEAQYKDIAGITAKVINKIPGNSAVFFPSYQLRDAVNNYFSKLSNKTVFVERPKMIKQEKLDFLESFKGYKNVGAVLMGVIGGNFGEGIDLPGDNLKGVVIVGLPLQRPDLETEALIKYYDEKFKKGWDYGYLLPAFNKALQSAGRCIRTENDRGIVVFIDERYAWNNYFRCFPPDWNIKITLLYEKLIDDFFKRPQ